MENEGKNLEVTKDEIAKSLTPYIAGQSGVSKEISPEEAGRKGAFISDLTKTGKNFLNGEIPQQKAEEKVIESTTSYTISPVIDKLVDKPIDISVDYFVKKLESKGKQGLAKVLKEIKNPLKKFIKQTLIAQTAKVAKKVWNKTKVHIKKMLKREK